MLWHGRRSSWQSHPIIRVWYECTQLMREIVRLLCSWRSAEFSVYDAWAEPWLDWIIEQGHEIVATELPVADGTIKTCGTIDAVIKGAHSGEMILCDYKCRKSKQFYDKDLWQLAIESWMLKRRYKLDYLPQCMSICIEVGSKKHHHKFWSVEEQENAIEIVKLISKLYWKLRQ